VRRAPMEVLELEYPVRPQAIARPGALTTGPARVKSGAQRARGPTDVTPNAIPVVMSQRWGWALGPIHGPGFVQTLMAEPAVEALREGILHRLAGLDELHIDAVLHRPPTRSAMLVEDAIVATGQSSCEINAPVDS